MTDPGAATESKPQRKRRGASATDGLGERVAEYRKDRRLKVSELARAVEVSPSLISQIERGQSQPSVSTLFALAEALEVPVDALFAKDQPVGEPAAVEPEPATAAAANSHTVPTAPGGRYLVRRAARAAIDIEGGVRWERLTPTVLPHVEFMELIYAPGGESNPELYRHPGSEMVLVLAGRLDIFVGFERYELGVGDSIHFPSTVPHRYVNPTVEEARAVTVIVNDAEAAAGYERLADAESRRRRP